jgi:citrate lyase subunit beta / citryl-CoA lyase
MNSILRSYLFVPASRPERIAKALRSGAHAVIVDLEDAVAPQAKDAARQAVADTLNPERPVLLRINRAGSESFLRDLALCSHPGVSGIMLAKTETEDDLRMLARQCPPGLAILPLIETARGMDNARAIAHCPGVQRLAFGALDFQLDMGIESGDMELACFRSLLVLVSRLAGIQSPIDSITAQIDAEEILVADTMHARRAGFGGKLCIHPRQVPVVNRCFLPTSDEVAWATKVVAAAEAAGGDPIALEGEMIDRPVLLKARRILSESAS